MSNSSRSRNPRLVGIVIVKRTPERREALLTVEQMFVDATTSAGRSRLEIPRDEFLLVPDLEDQGDSQRQIANHHLEQAADSLAIPSLKPLESRQLDFGSFDLTVPIADFSVSSFHLPYHHAHDPDSRRTSSDSDREGFQCTRGFLTTP